MSKSLLIVSNDPAVREMLSRTVAEAGYRPTLAGSCAEAVKILANAPFERVLCEVFLPDGSGVELKRRLRRLAPDARVIVASSFSVIRSSDDVLRFGSSDFILDQQELVDLVQAADGPREPAAPAPGGDERIKRVFIETIDVLVGLLELNDPFFGGNSHITMEYARAVAQAMDLPPDVVDEIVVASLLHDIGRVSIRNELLSEKPEISESEFNSIKSHCENGAKLLEAIDFPWKIRPIIVHHHERFDGKGYPKGLKGREIPVGSRILAVVDAFAAMTANRPYRRSLAREEAIRELHRNVGTQFDPEIVEIFGRVVEREFVFRGVGTKPRILLVDDEVDLLTLLKLKLVNEGFDVRVTDRAEEALQQIAEERPDLVVSDVSMPGMDGIAMYRKMREMGDAGDTPLLFLSGKSDTAIKVEALDLGAEDFLGKPVDLKELAARIRNIIRRDGKRRGGERSPPRTRGSWATCETWASPRSCRRSTWA